MIKYLHSKKSELRELISDAILYSLTDKSMFWYVCGRMSSYLDIVEIYRFMPAEEGQETDEEAFTRSLDAVHQLDAQLNP